MQSDLDRLLTERRSIRAYTQDPVERTVVESICQAARRAPSGANLQPGKFHVLSGPALDDLKDRLTYAHAEGQGIDLEYSYFPDPMDPKLKERQRQAGYALYESQGIARRDVAQRRALFARNYQFFDAPVGIVVTIDRGMGKGCYMDLGMSVMALMLSAEVHQLGTSGIGAIANYGALVHDHLNLPNDEMVVCGVALGYPDKAASINQFATDRMDLDEFTSFQGFDEEQTGKGDV